MGLISRSDSLRDCHVYLGGTFDPVHNGHIRMLVEGREALSASHASFVPCHVTPHKQQPSTSAQHRLTMLECVRDALQRNSQCQWLIETYELSRTEKSYTFHTLRHLREQLGKDASIVWLMGMDSFASLASWHRWQELLAYGHIAVFERPGSIWPQSPILTEWWQANSRPLSVIQESSHGYCTKITSAPMAISSTTLRAKLHQKQTVLGLLPESVEQYIHENTLY